MAIFDTHAHYVKNDFGEALHPLLSSMSEAGVEKIMAVGYDLDSSMEEMQLAEQYPFVWAAVGVHPENCEGLPADWLGQLAGMLSSPRVKALGEIGLDRHYEGCDKVLQAGVFERQLQLAKKLDVPVIIHSRHACEDTMELLRKYKPAGVMHCFSYSPEIAEEVVRLGMYVGFTGVLTFKNSKKAWGGVRSSAYRQAPAGDRLPVYGTGAAPGGEVPQRHDKIHRRKNGGVKGSFHGENDRDMP